MKLRALVLEGKYPGVTKQSDLWNDAMPHPGPIAWALMAYCNYAAVYQRSPVGLTWSDELKEEQRMILQNVAWETVSKYPYAGVSTIPLTGWKATEDLPDEPVVTDYNDSSTTNKISDPASRNSSLASNP